MINNIKPIDDDLGSLSDYLSEYVDVLGILSKLKPNIFNEKKINRLFKRCSELSIILNYITNKNIRNKRKQEKDSK